MKSLKSNKGFTLIELVVVIAILGILAGIAIPRFMDATATARGAKIVADLRTIDSAIMLYQAKNGSLPGAATDLTNANQSSAYLAAWPTPPSGTAIVNNNKNEQVKLTGTDTRSYTCNNTSGRAELGGNTVDAILTHAKGDLAI